jgi:hypothetical protein
MGGPEFLLERKSEDNRTGVQIKTVTLPRSRVHLTHVFSEHAKGPVVQKAK